MYCIIFGLTSGDYGIKCLSEVYKRKINQNTQMRNISAYL